MRQRDGDAHGKLRARRQRPETTGHEWDGVKELNKPLPRWWVWTFYATIVWAIGYQIAYPAWPTIAGYTTGACWAGQPARHRGRRGQVGARRPRPKLARAACARVPRPQVKSDPDPAAPFAMAGGAASIPVPIARRATAAARRVSSAIPISTTTTGSGWEASRGHPHKTILGARSRSEQKKETRIQRQDAGFLGPEQACSRTTARSAMVAEYVLAICGQSRAIRGPAARPGPRRCSPTSAPALPRPRRQRASRSRAPPT